MRSAPIPGLGTPTDKPAPERPLTDRTTASLRHERHMLRAPRMTQAARDRLAAIEAELEARGDA